jgi:hypothetical protein
MVTDENPEGTPTANDVKSKSTPALLSVASFLVPVYIYSCKSTCVKLVADMFM